MTYIMEASEIDDRIKYTGEWGEYLLSLITAEKLVGKNPGFYINSYGANFIRTSGSDNQMDYSLVMINRDTSTTFNVRFMIMKDRNMQLCNYVQRYADNNKNKVTYYGNSGRFYNINFQVNSLEEMKDLFKETFLKSEINW